MKRIFYIAILIFLVSSCTSKKQLVYLQDLDKESTEDFVLNQPKEYSIKNRDILYIKFITLDQNTNMLFNAVSGTQANMFRDESSIYIDGYVVSDSGYIDLPVIKKVKVEGLTLQQAHEEISKKSIKFLKDPTVIVKLISFKFTVLGEVNRPGVYKNFNNQLTVLEAIGMAGDIGTQGDRENILVIRPTENGTKTFRLNLKDKNILASEAYYLLPNDVVYVEPTNSKVFQLNIPTVSLFLTGVSSLILILNFINNQK